jgi:hypothetical protein
MKRRGFLMAPLAPLAAADNEPYGDREGRNNAYALELEQHLRTYIVEEYPARAARAWHRDYASQKAFLKSVEPNRRRYRAFAAPPDLRVSGALVRQRRGDSEWLTLPMGRLKAEALFAVPAGVTGRVPLVIAQHGIDSGPERPFGQGDTAGIYHDYAHALVKAGYAVLAPFNLSTVEKRNRIERLARLAGTTLPGIEFARMEALLTTVLGDPRIDSNRVGIWGISNGGMSAMFWTPLEPRLKCAIVCAWFNHRRNKMAVPDERYSCFLETREEHAFFNGWLSEFTDSDVVSLICPRPLQIQYGKKDRIAWWPQVVEEFEAAKSHYKRLGIDDRIALDLHDGVHEISLEAGLAFLKKWL